ncbi:MAG TPA: arylesterase [Archangium sp.]|uniref:arylesterase n=1 Tax=Archangium sp. TaxID=1872627 RepID=UPI002E33FC51|nr:arylesterase [Archangium sp.]HEX5748222.1 arylesterase [Archangium sp.]
MSQGYMRERTRNAGVLGFLVVTLAVGLAMWGPPAGAAAPARTVLVMGDSLSAAYGLAPEEGWVALTAERMAKEAPGWRVVNASVSGETTAGGAARIEGELARNRPAVVVIALGGNDGLRGLPLKQTRAHLEKMVGAAKAAGARVLLVGMRMPPNLGKAYTEGFAANYRTVAEAHKVSLLPFLLEPIAMERASFQADNIHPIAAVQPKLRDHVWPALAPLLK